MSGSSSRDRKTFRPGLMTLGTVLLLVIAGTVFRLKPPATQPLRPTQQVVVLLVPGLSLSDTRNTDSAGASRFIGVFPNRLSWRAGAAKLTILNPATQADFVRACDQLGGEKLGSALRGAGIRPVSLGDDPAAGSFIGASSATTDTGSADTARQWHTGSPHAIDGFVTDPVRLAQAIRRETGRSSGTPLLVAATFDDLLRIDSYTPLTRPVSADTQRRAARRRLNTLLAQLTGSGQGALPPGTALLLLSPVPPTEAAEQGELLGPVMLWQGSASPNAAVDFLLTSPSTRQTPGLIAPGDIAATVLQLSGISENSTGGRSATALETADAPTANSLAERVAHWAAQAREIRFLVTLPWLLAGALLVAAFFQAGKARAACVLGACAAPLALVLAAPFASQKPGVEALVYGIAGLMALAAALLGGFAASRQSGENPVFLLRGLFLATAAAIIVDMVTGGTLLARSPLSYSPISAARFYGIGNEISGVFLGASVLAVGVLCPTPLGAVLGGLIVCLVSGLPMFGADAGGFVSALVAFGILFVLLTAAGSGNKRRIRLRVGIGVGVVILLLLALYVAGSGRQSVGTRTHVGEAVTSARKEGTVRALLPLIRRKAATGVRLLFSSPWSILLVTETGICLWLWGRRSRGDTTAEAIYKGAFAAGGALLFVNDSGVVAAAACLLYPVSSLLLAPPFSPPSAAEMHKTNG